jgi:hypothetical protein
MKISFLDFWGDLSLDNNFIINILKEFKENVELVEPENSDLIFCSVFGEEHKKFFGKKKIIFYTGENIRPNFESYDLSLTFDFGDYQNRNVRLPLWYFYIDWFGKKTYGNPQYLIPEEYLYQPNEFSSKPRSHFCCAVFSKFDEDRFTMMSHLNQYKDVYGFGKVHVNKIPEGERAKMDLISNFKFSICFENSIYPGYFTEKLLHAKIAGTIPIYKSHNTFENDFNKNCCINLCNLNFSEIKDKIIEIDQNDTLYKSYYEQPLFNSPINLQDIGNKIISLI